MITRHQAQTYLLEPAVDAQACNDEQQLAIFNPSEQPDSIVELLGLLARASSRPGRQHLLELARLVRAVSDSNKRERTHERTIAGCADPLVRALRDQDLNGHGPVEAVLSAKAAVRVLRDPLAVLAAPADFSPRDVVEAAVAVRHVIRQLAPEVLLTATVEHDLKAPKFAVLRELVLHVKGAERIGAAGAQPIGTSDGRPAQ